MRRESGRNSAEGRGEVGEREKGGLDFFDELAIGFGLVAGRLPYGVIAKSIPIGGGGFAAGVREDIEESPALKRFVNRSPVGYVADAMLLEKLHGVFAEAA